MIPIDCKITIFVYIKSDSQCQVIQGAVVNQGSAEGDTQNDTRQMRGVVLFIKSI